MKGKAKTDFGEEDSVKAYEEDLKDRPMRYTNRSNVMDEAEERKYGGKAKHKLKRKAGGKVHGAEGLKHSGRKPRSESIEHMERGGKSGDHIASPKKLERHASKHEAKKLAGLDLAEEELKHKLLKKRHERAHGGKIFADKNPFSSARHGKE